MDHTDIRETNIFVNFRPAPTIWIGLAIHDKLDLNLDWRTGGSYREKQL
jgi:hypothetical protein